MFAFPTTPTRSITRRLTALASAGIHALVIIVVMNHPPAQPTPASPEPDTTPVWVPPSRATPPRDEPVSQPRGGPAAIGQMLDFPDMVPDQLPPPDLSGTPIDPRTLTGTSVPGGIDSLLYGFDRSGGSGASFNWRQVDQPPRLLEPGPLEYPPALDGTGLEGWVRLQFTVDTLGRAVPSSLHILEASHHLFIESARLTVLESGFEPGREKGQAVPVLVEQVIRYSSE